MLGGELYHAGPMRLGLLCVVLSLVCGTATACATGLSGAAVGAPSPPAPGTPVGVNLLPNGSFTAGTDPWLSNEAANLYVTTALFPSTVLVLQPTAPGSPFSAKAVVTTTPSKGQKYRFEAWMKGSPDLVGTPVQIELDVVETTTPTTGPPTTQSVVMAQEFRPLGRDWRHFSLTGVVPSAGASNVTAIVAIQSRSKYSRLALNDVAAELLPKPSQPRHGGS
jgi:hypothetical protein